jgi:sortase B
MARLAQPSQVQQESQLDIQSEQSTEDDIIETIASAVEAAPQLTPKLAEEPAEEALESSEQPIEEEIEPYISPVDFDALWAINPDIYAWIYIPNTEISYPILQHDTDDDYYLSHDCYGNDSPLEGSIFTEKTYTSEEFTDPVTVVYGHRLKTGTMFSTLQSTYSTAEGMADCKEIIIYLPDREYHYTVVAAVPYDNRHILYNYDFSSNRMFRAFLNSIYSVREIGAVFDQDTVASPKDRLLILSTCLYGNAQKRYLVLAKCEEDINSPS